MVWVPYTKTNGQWIASKILQGFFGAPVESLCEISVTDLYFTHERGAYLAIYGFLLAGSNFFAPIIAGFIADGQGWEWVLYWCAIFCAIGFVFCFFFMEETNYYRGEHTTPPQTGAQTPMIADDSVLATPDEKHPVVESVPEGTGTIVYKPKTYLDKLKPFAAGTFSRPNRLGGMILRPLIFLSFPVIFYAGFCYGANLVWFNVLNATASLILSGEPYNFAASMVGVAYVSPLISVAICTIYTGSFGNWFVIKMARRNNGVMEPEHRLWLFSTSLILLPFGLILWGVGAAHQVHWFGLIFAMAVIA